MLIDDVAEDMGPTALLPGSHGTRDSPPAWVHTEERQPRALPGMATFTVIAQANAWRSLLLLPLTPRRVQGQAGDILLNDVSIWHASTPNLHPKRARKLVWALWGPGFEAAS